MRVNYRSAGVRAPHSKIPSNPTSGINLVLFLSLVPGQQRFFFEILLKYHAFDFFFFFLNNFMGKTNTKVSALKIQ